MYLKLNQWSHLVLSLSFLFSIFRERMSAAHKIRMWCEVFFVFSVNVNEVNVFSRFSNLINAKRHFQEDQILFVFVHVIVLSNGIAILSFVYWGRISL